MYNINIDKYIDFLTWNNIYWGIKKGIIAADNAILYVNKILDRNPDSATPEIIELLIADNTEKENILPQIAKIISNEKMLKASEQESVRTLRFIVLRELQHRAVNDEELLNEAEAIYADFCYPTDMEEFIAYMPVQDDYNLSEHTESENYQRLIDKFNVFMEKEQEWIKENKTP